MNIKEEDILMNKKEDQEEVSLQNLPDTQNTDSQFTQSQSQATLTPAEVLQPWGRLYALESTLSSLQLIKEVYTFGRHPDCAIFVTGKLPEKREKIISKVHFQIRRDKVVSSNGHEDDVVYLTDESQNGTFVNRSKVGKGKTVVLVNNDLIAVAKTNFNVYVYMSTSGYDNSFLPNELKDKYAISRTLGAGACGEVKLCFSKCGVALKKYAMKIISKAKITPTDHKTCQQDDKHIMNEVNICKRLKHPCIIRVKEVHDSPSAVFIVLELMEGGELFERIRKYNGLSEKQAKFIFYQVVLAVAYLHENDVTHRDLKPENILLASNEDETIVKVSDFGLSKLVDSHTMMKTFCGTPMYVAPEILLTGGRGSYTSLVDVWSLGVILYCSLSGFTPFNLHDKAHTLYDQIIKGMYNFNNLKFMHVSANAKDLIRKMMTVNPQKRINIKKVLAHPWLNDKEMLMKVNNLLGFSDNENILPRRPLNVTLNHDKFKRTSLE